MFGGGGLIDGISTCGQRGRQERVNVFDWLVNVLVVSLTHSFLCSGVRDAWVFMGQCSIGGGAGGEGCGIEDSRQNKFNAR